MQGRGWKMLTARIYTDKHIVYISIFASPHQQISELFAVAGPPHRFGPLIVCPGDPTQVRASQKSKLNLRGSSSTCQPESGCRAEIGMMEEDKHWLRPLPTVPCSKCLWWQTVVGGELSKLLSGPFRCVVAALELGGWRRMREKKICVFLTAGVW